METEYRNSKGQLHREDGPALEYVDGSKFFWYLNGELHREDGPAVEYANGDKRWYINGKRHRKDGPAVEHTNGDKYWFLEGVEYSEEEYKIKTEKKVPFFNGMNCIKCGEFNHYVSNGNQIDGNYKCYSCRDMTIKNL